MTVGNHYADETDLAKIITIPIAAGSLADYLEATLQMIDDRINYFCHLASNTTDAADAAALNSVETNAFLKVMKNTRLSREGVPAESTFTDSYFSAEDHLILIDMNRRHKRTLWVEQVY